MIKRKNLTIAMMIAATLFFIAFPEFLFTVLGILLLIIIIVFFIVEFAFDIYIVVAVIAKWFRNE
ncbi:MAG: hypothetical protein B6D59_07320 [Campylobacteraceae bacterium 4484_4]|nr:MAG: hypothetical protein B6D59_07320 [Campylobacteraceae bacterium 4484_4]